MQSDPRIRAVFDVLALPLAEFRVLLAATLARAERRLATTTTDASAQTARAGVELGRFAEGRVNPEWLAGLAPREAWLDGGDVEALVASIAVLRDALSRGEALFLGEVPPGGKLGETVSALVAGVGRAIGAAQQVEHWSRADRRSLPPLIVAVEGADLHPSALVDYCDGRFKLVLVVSGPCAPAPLVRLITPGTLVLQTTDATGLDRLAQYDGPAVAALVPETAARFLHDPTAGKESWQRTRVDHLPEPSRRAIGGISAWQQAEDLRLLATLAKSVSTPQVEPHPAPNADAVERLTAWLLAGVDSP